jgi:nucleoredoxin
MKNLIPFGWLLISLLVSGVTARAATLEEIAANQALWPTEVVVLTGTKATVLKQDQPAGVMLLGAGKPVAVIRVTATDVIGRSGGIVVQVPANKTDLLQRAGAPGAAGASEPAKVAAPAGAVASAAAPVGGSSVMQRRLSGKVVRLGGSALQPVDDSALAGVKYYALYYSASWCGPCKQFTPELVKAYKVFKAAYPEFEVLFLSADRSAGDMRDYMRADKMPWLALKYDLIEKNPELMRYSGPGIPCLVLVDASGKVLADSFEGGNYVGPGKVLTETAKILQRGR